VAGEPFVGAEFLVRQRNALPATLEELAAAVQAGSKTSDRPHAQRRTRSCLKPRRRSAAGYRQASANRRSSLGMGWLARIEPLSFVPRRDGAEGKKATINPMPSEKAKLPWPGVAVRGRLPPSERQATILAWHGVARSNCGGLVHRVAGDGTLEAAPVRSAAYAQAAVPLSSYPRCPTAIDGRSGGPRSGRNKYRTIVIGVQAECRWLSLT